MKMKHFFAILLLVPFSTGEDITEVDIVTSTQPPTSITENENVPPAINSVVNDYPTNYQPSVPNFGFGNSPPYILHNLLSQVFRPTKNTGKTYGPNVIAIIGDKPYISMEIFHKFAPFRWLMHAFQGKIQNICGFLAPPIGDDEFSFSNPQNNPPLVLGDEQTPVHGAKPDISRPVRIYNVPIGFRRKI
ncbi:hypothetical protein HUJ04_000602 [Dendroctonus ponderosae]|uniref:Uncharacterized protein n=1 Tax=Dendroctonus ponderosae TaxID=77166 RepID=A0AAR5NZQ2_DENPD|nr:hypothetical protein HUJ04_000602 [Dendroctonus ponderosae]